MMFSLIGWQAKLGEVVICAVLCFSAYTYIGHRAVEAYKGEEAIEQAKVDKQKQDKYDQVSTELETLKAKRAENAKIIEHTTERIISKEPVVYTTTCISPDGLLNA